MLRQNRLALLGALVLLLIVAGTALANRTPRTPDEPMHLASSHEAVEDSEDAPPTADEVAHAVERLAAADIAVDETLLADLAARHGLGGAIRLIAWADETGLTVEEIEAMRSGDGSGGGRMGWGKIARELGVHPGIGTIMGGGKGSDD
jgi:hypothetical protein